MAPHPSSWLKLLPQGLYCEPGGFFIDPLRAVDRAVVTHAHSDHARPGHRHVLATRETLALMRARMGAERAGQVQQALGWGEALDVNGVEVRLLPAGHVLGSAQVALTYRGSRAVVSGDYKRQADPTCRGFEPAACDVFVTEATFALPVFRHPPAGQEIARLLASVALFPERTHVVGCYALGKCQRLIALLRAAGWDRPIFLHGALAAICEVYTALGQRLGDLPAATVAAKQALVGAIVLAPPGAVGRPLGAAAGRSGGGGGLGLDAGAPAGEVARGGAAAGDLRPRGLGRAECDDRRGGRARGVGDARPGGCADPCRGAARGKGAGAAAGRVWGGGRGGGVRANRVNEARPGALPLPCFRSGDCLGLARITVAKGGLSDDPRPRGDSCAGCWIIALAAPCLCV